jgi:hypothetical protein
VARGRGALDVAIGGALARLSEGDRVLQLGYSGIGDYARERLGMAGRTAQAMARLAVELRTRPLLAEAVRRGEVSARKAQAVLPLARGQDEEQWVARAQTETVRALEAAVRAAGPADVAEEEGWDLVCVPLSPEGRATLDQALELAGKHLGPGAPQWQRLEAICQEYLAAHPVDTSDGVVPSAGEQDGRLRRTARRPRRSVHALDIGGPPLSASATWVVLAGFRYSSSSISPGGVGCRFVVTVVSMVDPRPHVELPQQDPPRTVPSA